MGCTCNKSVSVAQIEQAGQARYLYANNLESRQRSNSTRDGTNELRQSLDPREIAAYYDIRNFVKVDEYTVKTYFGKGVKVAIIHLGGPVDLTELRRDFEKLRSRMPDVSVVNVAGVPSNQTGDGLEVHLDVEVIGSICPEATITVYRSKRSHQGFADAILKATEDSNHIISISWGMPEWPSASTSAIELALVKARLDGITVCVASGDDGSSCRLTDGRAHVDYPAASPFVLACGGTQLMGYEGYGIKGITNERVWNDSNGSTGGGVSLIPRPPWQWDAGVATLNVNTHHSGRVVPDVSGVAAVNWKIFDNNGNSEVRLGGTSAVAPLWAALLTIVNQMRFEQGKGALGFISEALYSKACVDSGCFHDITEGNNQWKGAPGYEAKKGFDACTGWGRPVGTALCKFLVEL